MYRLNEADGYNNLFAIRLRIEEESSRLLIRKHASLQFENDTVFNRKWSWCLDQLTTAMWQYHIVEQLVVLSFAKAPISFSIEDLWHFKNSATLAFSTVAQPT